MMCSKEKATFGPIFDQLLQALINTLGPQCNLALLPGICSASGKASIQCPLWPSLWPGMSGGWDRTFSLRQYTLLLWPPLRL